MREGDIYIREGWTERRKNIYVTCPNEMSRMSKKIELVTPLERRCINLSNGVKIMDISHTQPKLLDAKHA